MKSVLVALVATCGVTELAAQQMFSRPHFTMPNQITVKQRDYLKRQQNFNKHLGDRRYFAVTFDAHGKMELNRRQGFAAAEARGAVGLTLFGMSGKLSAAIQPRIDGRAAKMVMDVRLLGRRIYPSRTYSYRPSYKLGLGPWRIVYIRKRIMVGPVPVVLTGGVSAGGKSELGMWANVPSMAINCTTKTVVHAIGHVGAGVDAFGRAGVELNAQLTFGEQVGFCNLVGDRNGIRGFAEAYMNPARLELILSTWINPVYNPAADIGCRIAGRNQSRGNHGRGGSSQRYNSRFLGSVGSAVSSGWKAVSGGFKSGWKGIFGGIKGAWKLFRKPINRVIEGVRTVVQVACNGYRKLARVKAWNITLFSVSAPRIHYGRKPFSLRL